MLTYYSIDENWKRFTKVIFIVFFFTIWRNDASNGSWRSEWLPYKIIRVWGPWRTTELWWALYTSQALTAISLIRGHHYFFSKRELINYKINFEMNVITRFFMVWTFCWLLQLFFLFTITILYFFSSLWTLRMIPYMCLEVDFLQWKI